MPNNAGEADTHDLATAYEPTEHERAALKAYFARDETCPPAPRMKVVQTDGAKAFKIDHPNPVVGQVLRAIRRSGSRRSSPESYSLSFRLSQLSFPSSASPLGSTDGSTFVASTNCTELLEILNANSLTAPTGLGLASIRHDSQKLNRPCRSSRLRAHSKSICTVSGSICAWCKKTLVEWGCKLMGV